MVPAVVSDSAFLPPEASFFPDNRPGKPDKMDEIDLGGGGRTGLMVIRAWVEEGSSEPLRVHIRLTTDVSKGYQRTLSVSNREAASAVVEGWLMDLMADTTSRH